jgi:hypothetical protein
MKRAEPPKIAASVTSTHHFLFFGSIELVVYSNYSGTKTATMTKRFIHALCFVLLYQCDPVAAGPKGVRRSSGRRRIERVLKHGQESTVEATSSPAPVSPTPTPTTSPVAMEPSPTASPVVDMEPSPTYSPVAAEPSPTKSSKAAPVVDSLPTFSPDMEDRTRALLPFSLSLVGQVQQEEDVVVTMQMYLFYKLSESFDSLEWIMLEASVFDDENRKLQEETISLTGQAVFLDEENVLDHEFLPREDEVHQAQLDALALFKELGGFVTGQGVEWEIEGIDIADEGENTANEEPLGEHLGDFDNLQKGTPPSEDEKNKIVVVLVPLLAVALCIGLVGYVRAKKIDKGGDTVMHPRADSAEMCEGFVLPSEVPEKTEETAGIDAKYSPSWDRLLGYFWVQKKKKGVRILSDDSSEMSQEFVQSEGPEKEEEATDLDARKHLTWDHVLQFSSKGIVGAEKDKLSQSTEKKKPPAENVVPRMEQTERVELRKSGEARETQNSNADTSAVNSTFTTEGCSDDSSSGSSEDQMSYLQNTSFTMPRIDESSPGSISMEDDKAVELRSLDRYFNNRMLTVDNDDFEDSDDTL